MRRNGRPGSWAAKLWTLISAVALAAVPVLGPLGAAPAAAADVTVLSSTFDDGVSAPWFANGGASLTVVPDPDGTGQSLEVSNITHDYDGAAVDLTQLLTPGVAYSIGFEARLADGAQPAGAVHFTVDDGSYTWVSGPSALSADAWTTITGSYTLSPSATSATMYLNSGSTPFPVVLLDDVTITGPAGGSGGGTCTPTSPTALVSATFDDQTLDGLQQDGDPTSLAYESVAGGDVALRVNGRSNDFFGVQTAPGAFSSVAAGQTLSLSARVRIATATTATAAMRLVAVPGYSWIGNQPAVSSTAWTTITGTYTVPAGTDTSALEFYVGTDNLGDGTSTYDYFVDDVTITLPGDDCGGSGGGTTCTYPTSDTIISSGFENGDEDGWAGRDDGHGTATVAVVDGGHDSAGALSATGRAGQGQGVGHDVTCLLEPGVTYQFSGWVRFADGQPTDDVWLSLASTAGGSTTYTTEGQFTNVTNDGWAQVTQKFTMPASSDEALLYLETRYYSDGSAGNTSDLLFDELTVTRPAPAVIQDITPIKDTLPFPVGAAVSSGQLAGSTSQLLAKHFDQVTPENYMKPEAWYDANHQFVTTNTEADALMTYAQQNDLRVYGHTLVWYQQTPDWFFQHDDGTWLTNSPADQAILRSRLDAHVDSVARYLADEFGPFGSPTNPLVAFDVVNEAVSDNSGDPEGLRQSHWYQVLGESYIEEAFNDADQAFNVTYAAPGSTHPVALFLNDYNTEQTGKRARALDLVTRLVADGVPVDGIGHQFHVTMSTPVSTLKDAIDAFAGIQSDGHQLYQAVTELDVPTGTPVTTANEVDQGYYYQAIFDMLRAAQASYGDIFSATVWGLTDGQSWRADAGAPLLFDDDLQAKPAYYGVTDQPLPAKQLSAIVFAQDSSDVDVASPDATADAEWAQLPLHAIGADAGFQLRWSPDHLTAYVAVTDATADAGDAATFAWGPGLTATVGRDGTVTGGGVTAQVASTAGGWKAVVDLPVSPALTASATPKLDVAVTDGTQTADWNTPGNLGTLQLVEPLSYSEIPEAGTAPTIDGSKDAVWSRASTVTTGKVISGAADGATATVYQLWQDHYLYVLADVNDPTIDTSSPNAYEQDSVEIFTDPGNAKNGSYRPDDAQMRISVDNVVSFGTGDEAAQAARLTSATARTATGYAVEARIDLLDQAGPGTFQGVDYEVNDGTGGVRTSNVGWAEPTGTAYQATARWGVAQLVGPRPPLTGDQLTDADRGPVDLPAVLRQGDTVTVGLGRQHAGETVDVWLYSDPVQLPSVTASKKGVVTLTVPADAPTGAHRIALFATGGALLGWDGVTVIGAHDPALSTAPPVIVGTPAERQVLRATTGTWAPADGLRFAFQWQRDGAPIPWANGPVHVVQKADVGHVLTVVVTATERGFPAASATSQPVTVVQPLVAPKITRQPQDVSAKAGATVTFTASATGQPVPTVQWQSRTGKGAWKDVVAATSPALVVQVTTVLDGTAYRAVFTNAAGSATTRAATLAVKPGSKPVPPFWFAPGGHGSAWGWHRF